MKHGNKRPNATVSIEFVTPEMCRKWLDAPGIVQRPRRKLTVARLKKAMADGAYLFNGESLIFDTAGKMIDGQHRCTACVESGVGFWSVVVRGVENSNLDASATIDTGGARTGADVAVMDGMPLDRTEAGCLAAAARYIVSAELGSPLDVGSNLSGVLSNSDILDALRRHPGLVEALRFVRATRYRRRILGPSGTTALYYWMSKVDEALAASYFDQVSEGMGLTKEHVAYRVRSTLGLLDGSGAPHMTMRAKCAVFIKGWNILRQGRPTPQLLVYRAANNEPYPEIDGLPWKALEIRGTAA
mgnify:FL=1